MALRWLSGTLRRFEGESQGPPRQVTVVDSLASVSASEWVTAQGRWVQDREFGLQFLAEMLASTAPTTRGGIMVKGIGPVDANGALFYDTQELLTFCGCLIIFRHSLSSLFN